MEDMLVKSNSGLASRIKKIQFDNYSGEELFEIMKMMIPEMGMRANADFMEYSHRVLVRYAMKQKNEPNFGNARYIRESYLADAVTAMNARLVTKYGKNIPPEENRCMTGDDIPETLRPLAQDPLPEKDNRPQKNMKTALEQIDELEGMEEIKAYFHTLSKLVEASQKPGMSHLLEKMSLHMVLTGNPGTGKTTVARLIAKAYNELGLLPEGKLIEVDAKDLVAGYVGQTAIKTADKLREAMGGTLFIDEAYSLVSEGNTFGSEAIATILKTMEDHNGDFAVITAGYQKEMDHFIKQNTGLKSRFTKQYHIPNHTDEQLIAIFKSMCSQIQAIPSESLLECLPRLLTALRQDAKLKNDAWANGREIRNLVQALKEQWADTQEMTETADGTYILFTLETLPQKYSSLLVKEAQNINKKEEYRLPENAIISPNEIFTYPSDVSVLERGVVLIETNRTDGMGYGSGSILTSDGYILTCSHVIHGADTVRVRLKIAGRTDGDISWHTARIIRDDFIHDCALIKIDIWGYPSLSITSADYEIHPTDEIFLLGYPFGVQIANSTDDLALSFFEGKVSSIQQNNGFDRVFINMEAKSGCSGAPVFSQKTGCIIGILCGSQTSKNGSLVEEINFILPMQEIRKSLFK